MAGGPTKKRLHFQFIAQQGTLTARGPKISEFHQSLRKRGHPTFLPQLVGVRWSQREFQTHVAHGGRRRENTSCRTPPRFKKVLANPANGGWRSS